MPQSREHKMHNHQNSRPISRLLRWPKMRRKWWAFDGSEWMMGKDFFGPISCETTDSESPAYLELDKKTTHKSFLLSIDSWTGWTFFTSSILVLNFELSAKPLNKITPPVKGVNLVDKISKWYFLLIHFFLFLYS